MAQKIPERDLIHIFSRYSSMKPAGIEAFLTEKKVYADTPAWIKFIDKSLMLLGVIFSVAGIIFFFAYNWQDMHKFVKLALVQGLLITAVMVVVLSRLDLLIRNLILLGASLLTGALFALFGQIYQTGADAYDFFLGWTIFIVLWTVVSGFAPLWLLLTGLINITIVLYAEQIAGDWSAPLVYCILFVVNTALYVSLALPGKTLLLTEVPKWFSNTLAAAAVTCSTISIVSGIIYRYDTAWYISFILVLLAYITALVYSFKSRKVFHLFIVPLSVIIIVAGFLVDTAKGNDTLVFFIVSLFIISSVSVLISQILKLNRAWNGR